MLKVFHGTIDAKKRTFVFKQNEEREKERKRNEEITPLYHLSNKETKSPPKIKDKINKPKMNDIMQFYV